MLTFDPETDGVLVFSTDAHGKSREDAAREFAATYFDKPRRLWKVFDSGRFELVDGAASYQIVYRPAVPHATIGVFRIYRMPEGV